MLLRMLCMLGAALLAGCTSSAPTAEADPANQTAAPTFAEQELVEELVLSNRILASKETNVFDHYGQVSVRSQADPNHYYISRWVAPGFVTLSEQQAILLKGRVNFIRPIQTAAVASSPDGSGGGRTARERFWEYWRQKIKVD